MGSDSCSPPPLHPSICPRVPPSHLPSLSQACGRCLSLCTQIVSVSAPTPPPHKRPKRGFGKPLAGKFKGICLESSGHVQLAVPMNPRGTIPYGCILSRLQECSRSTAHPDLCCSSGSGPASAFPQVQAGHLTYTSCYIANQLPPSLAGLPQSVRWGLLTSLPQACDPRGSVYCFPLFLQVAILFIIVLL